jgi:FemAB-related protein (PEP-CTERM system-associated)
MNQDSSHSFVVKFLASTDCERWDNFVKSTDDGTFFHLSGWREIIEEFLGHKTYYFLVERDEKIVGVLPLARVKSWLFGDALISLPFLVYGGVLAGDPKASKVLQESAADLANELQVDYLELRNRVPVTDWPAKNSYVTFRKELLGDPEENFLAIPRKQRAVVRKAIKAGLTVEHDSDVNSLYGVLSECKRNLGTPFFSRNYLQAIKEKFGTDCEILNINHEGEVLSSVMSFRFRNEILPYYGGGGLAARKFGANDFMYWKVMESACQTGVDIFDFGRSLSGSGAYKFKKYWGFEPEPLSYEYLLVKSRSVPQLDPSNKRYKHLINTWSKLPLPVTRFLGPPIARRLG